MSPHDTVQGPQIGACLPVISGQLIDQRAYAMDNFMVRQGQDEILGKRVEQTEGELVVVIAAIEDVYKRQAGGKGGKGYGGDGYGGTGGNGGDGGNGGNGGSGGNAGAVTSGSGGSRGPGGAATATNGSASAEKAKNGLSLIHI